MCPRVHSFGADGYTDVSVKDFNSWHQGSIDLSKIGFFLTTSEAEAQLEVDLSQVHGVIQDGSCLAKVTPFTSRQLTLRSILWILTRKTTTCTALGSSMIVLTVLGGTTGTPWMILNS